jgi:hypothetical protein
MLEHVGWLKAFNGVWKAFFDRLALWVSRRRPKLYVHFQPGTNIWCTANSGPGPNPPEYMQVVCQVTITHDDPQNSLIIIDAYPVGTKTQVQALSEIKIPPHTMVKERIVSIVAPMIGEKGKPWTGKMVLVDQFLRKYKTGKMTFKWAGGSS